MIKEINEWFNRNYITIFGILIFVTIIFISSYDRTTAIEDCELKCSELGYTYFYSEPSKFFGLKERICKCKDSNNEIKEIL